MVYLGLTIPHVAPFLSIGLLTTLLNVLFEDCNLFLFFTAQDPWRRGGNMENGMWEDSKLSGWSDDRTLMRRDVRLIL